MTDPRVTSPADDSAFVEGEKIQGSPGVLKPTKTPVETIEEIPVQETKPFRGIPDFRQPTISAYPAVVKAYDQYLCIDGFELVEKAASGGVARTRCRIFHLDHPDEIETALLKAAVRSMPPGGTCTYTEMVGNTVRLFGMLMGSGQNLEIFSHGGARRGTRFTRRRDQDAITILEERLGRKRKTILKQLEHGAYLNEEALKALVEADVPKGFFEAMQQGKAALVAELKTAQRPPVEIVEAVSAQMLVWLKEARTPVPIEISPTGDLQAVQATAKKASRSSQTAKAREFSHWAGNEPGAASEPPIDEECLRKDIKRIGIELVKLSKAPNLAESTQIQAIRDLTIDLFKLASCLLHLSNKEVR